MVGCSAAMCAERGTNELGGLDRAAYMRAYQKAYYRRRNGKPSPSPALAPPLPQDALHPGTCRYCGLRGAHGTPAACIDALRDRLARWE